MSLLIKNGRIIDPASNIDGILDVLVDKGKIAKTAKNIESQAAEIIDAAGKIVIPGLVDMHAHLREPGREDKETIESGTRAALKGGITSVLAMPNTIPAIDSIETVRLLKKLIDRAAKVNVFIAAAITKSRLGKEPTDILKLKKQGVAAISDDGVSVDDPGVFLNALKKAKQAKIPVICHCEDKVLSNSGVVNLGIVSTKLGLRGIPRESEYKRVERDIKLAQKTGACVHIAHVSCKESVEIIAKAKRKGICVTAETAPHYFSLAEEDIGWYNTNMKINPPLRTAGDVSAIKEGLKSGVIDVIASDHAPHTENEKDIEFDRAEFGTVGLETELSVSVKELIDTGVLDWPELIRKLAYNPAKILNIDKGTLQIGKPADMAIVSADKEWVVRRDNLISKSRNSAFLGRTLKAVVEYTIFGGEIVYKSAA